MSICRGFWYEDGGNSISFDLDRGSWCRENYLGKDGGGRLSIPFDDELGKRLRARELKKSHNNHAFTNLAFFDEEIMHREMLRDILAKGPRVVETWHPGNLAFCRERNSIIFERYRSLVISHLTSLPGLTFIQPLRINREILRKRQSEFAGNGVDLHDFFWRVSEATESLAHEFGLQFLPPVQTDQADPVVCCETIISHLHPLPG